MMKMGFKTMGDLYSQDVNARRAQGGFPSVSTSTIEPSERSPSMTMKLLSETVQRAPDDLDPVSTRIGMNDILDGLRQKKAEFEQEKLAADTVEHEASEAEMNRIVLRSILDTQPHIVFELLIEMLEGRDNG